MRRSDGSPAIIPGERLRPDLEVVAAMVPTGSRVLDLGCGDGALLAHLISQRNCEGHGVEIDGDDVLACIAAGVPVSEGDIEDALRDFDEGAFDVVLLSWTLQTTRRPGAVVAGMMRVAPVGIVSFPNFAHWRLRAALALRGRMPSSPTLPQEWHETPNIHVCTLADFESLAASLELRVSERVLLGPTRGPAGGATAVRANLLAAAAVCRLERTGSDHSA
jgi:methionine biosynthesis protein MetW